MGGDRSLLKKLIGKNGKACLKRALEPHLPDDVLYRDKMGFAVPISSWFRNELAQEIRDVVSGPRLLESGIFDESYLATILKDHQSGVSEHSPALWALLVFDGFIANMAGI